MLGKHLLESGLLSRLISMVRRLSEEATFSFTNSKQMGQFKQKGKKVLFYFLLSVYRSYEASRIF